MSGLHHISYVATDSSGNRASCQFTVDVKGLTDCVEAFIFLSGFKLQKAQLYETKCCQSTIIQIEEFKMECIIRLFLFVLVELNTR